MKDAYPKEKILAATRELMWNFAVWVDQLYTSDYGSDRVFSSHLFQLEWNQNTDLAPESFQQPGGVGTTIEQSAAIRDMGRIVDCLNSGFWNGTPDDLDWSIKSLNPLLHAVRVRESLLDQHGGGVVSEDAAALFCSVLDAISAMLSLDMDYSISLREMSFISGLAIKTVRMAAIGRDKNPDLKTMKTGKYTWIETEEAIKWLEKKNINYKRIQYKSQGELPVIAPTNIKELAGHLEDLRINRSPSFDEMESELNWDANMTNAYMKLESGDESLEATLFDFKTILALAEYLCPDQSHELVRRIDSILRPFIIEKRLNMNSNEVSSEDK